MAAATTRTRLQRVRASLGIAQLALQQVQNDLSADDVDARELAAILRELQEDIDVPGVLFPMLAQVISTTARRAEQIEPDRDASCPLHEVAALITVNAGQRLTWTARSLDPQGDIE
ncbi:hypothetical protein [Streptomyces hawaiiensis]|jgi:hypothetical protein|uniref:hypothetical protein n=1 Tax=Streptomyces hawaiiensis TaxID=67305 RepID=UPI003655C5E2